MGRNALRNRTWDQWRDLVVRRLARLSLVAVLVVLGAVFVGSAATSDASPDRATDSSVLPGDRIRPVGTVIGAAVVGAGLVVLAVGAFRPEPRDHDESRVLVASSPTAKPTT